ncbi:hypothetical protein EFW17_16245 [Halostreptopolyspora alba]|uniref:Uncharacterized protein n=2 Tax=Halostreptopolyspora alba TaxID=2487137 RepID=A0A3N0E625_9ACTN|nr:hypothetical protein EFW17_16245 [Nocardiopsaceae bacterium YIM 96095]
MGGSGTAAADEQEAPEQREQAQESSQEAAQERAQNDAADSEESRGDAREESTTVKYGPWTIPAADDGHEDEEGADAAGGLPGWPGNGDDEGDGHAHHGQEGGIEFNVDKPCEDCFITGFTPKMTYADDGTDAHVNEGPMLHHYVIFNSGARDAVCPGSERKLSSGNERVPSDLPEGYGIKIDERERWSLNYDLMNMDPAEAKDVNIEIDFTYVPASKAGDMKPLTPLWLDVGGCFGSEYDAPEGDSTESATWTSDVSGDLVYARGHLHHAGHSLWAENTTRGTELCHIEAEEGGSPEFIDMEGHGQISDMPPCSGDLGRIEEGDVLETSARYVIEGHSHDDVMGIMIGYLAED